MEKKNDEIVEVLQGNKTVEKKVSDLAIDEVLTVPEFLKKYGHEGVPNATIYYRMDKTDDLDFIRKHDTRFIIKNKKCRSFELSDAGRKRTSTMTM